MAALIIDVKEKVSIEFVSKKGLVEDPIFVEEWTVIKSMGLIEDPILVEKEWTDDEDTLSDQECEVDPVD